MDGSDYLYACVEAGVALSGFAALALAIRSRTTVEYTAFERLSVATLVERGLAVAFLALLPLLLHSFSLNDGTLWAASSGTFFAYGVSTLVRGFRARRSGVNRDLASLKVLNALLAAGCVVLLLQVANALNVGVDQGVSWYLLAVTWLLFSAAYRFWFFLASWVRAA